MIVRFFVVEFRFYVINLNYYAEAELNIPFQAIHERFYQSCGHVGELHTSNLTTRWRQLTSKIIQLGSFNPAI